MRGTTCFPWFIQSIFLFSFFKCVFCPHIFSLYSFRFLLCSVLPCSVLVCSNQVAAMAFSIFMCLCVSLIWNSITFTMTFSDYSAFVIETKMNFDQTLFCFRSMFALRLEYTIDSTSYNVQKGKKRRIFRKKMKKEKRRENENGHFRANEKK